MRFSLVCILFLSGCGSDNSSVNKPENSSGEGDKQVISPYKMIAEKSYKPSLWQDDHVDFGKDVVFKLPALAKVTSGMPGNHWLHLSFNEETSSEVICIYKGNGSRSKTKAPCSNNNGNAYVFYYCAFKQDYADNNCSNNPFKKDCQDLALDWQAVDNIVSQSIRLSVANGDSCGASVVEIIL